MRHLIVDFSYLVAVAGKYLLNFAHHLSRKSVPEALCLYISQSVQRQFPAIGMRASSNLALGME